MKIKTPKIVCSIGICAYNEEKNIGKILQALLNQKLKTVKISKIVVVASGCTDKTEKIVRDFQKKYPIVKLIQEKERRGKVSAINLFLKSTKDEILVLISADTIPQKDAIEKLVTPFLDPKIGMTGGHPIPINKKDSLVGYAVNLQWELHHLISLKAPKMGEMVAFRRVFKQIDPKSAVDEASMEVIIAAQGYQIKYIPQAIVYNKGPETIHDFLRQRRRIYAGHLSLSKKYNYNVSTMDPIFILQLLPLVIDFRPRFILYLFGTIFLEVIGRIFGWLDFYLIKRDHSKWKVARSSKNLIN